MVGKFVIDDNRAVFEPDINKHFSQIAEENAIEPKTFGLVDKSGVQIHPGYPDISPEHEQYLIDCAYGGYGHKIKSALMPRWDGKKYGKGLFLNNGELHYWPVDAKMRPNHAEYGSKNFSEFPSVHSYLFFQPENKVLLDHGSKDPEEAKAKITSEYPNAQVRTMFSDIPDFEIK